MFMFANREISDKTLSLVREKSDPRRLLYNSKGNKMRLWHIDLLKNLPRHQLLGQWRECTAIKGTIRKHDRVNHSTINYVNDHDINYLYAYALVVADEMIRRGYHPADDLVDSYVNDESVRMYNDYMDNSDLKIYPEHDAKYRIECKENLKRKGIII